MLDQDRNGILDMHDFTKIGEALCILWRYRPGTAEYKRVMAQSENSWHMFESYFESQKAQANLSHFLHFFDQMLSPERDEMYQNWVTHVLGDVFDSFDLNNDGVISLDEYVDMFMCYHIKVKYSAKAFLKLDRNGDNQVSKAELLEAINDFFKSNDPKSSGNWLFGFWGDVED